MSRIRREDTPRTYQHDDGAIIEFHLVRSSRQTLGLYVHRNGRIEVRVPFRTTLAEVQLFLLGRFRWLQGKLREFAELPEPVQPVWAEGSRVAHLGRSLTLRQRSGGSPSVARQGDELWLAVPHDRVDDHDTLAVLVERWLRREAERVFPLRLAYCHEHMRELGIPFPKLRIRKMKSRWGSCTQSGVVTLNSLLVAMAPELIDYVIIHELCHLVEFNHSPRFYALMGHYLPEWRQHREQLMQQAHSLQLW